MVKDLTGIIWHNTQGAHGQDRMTRELEQWVTQNNVCGEAKLTQVGFINTALFKTVDVDTTDIIYRSTEGDQEIM